MGLFTGKERADIAALEEANAKLREELQNGLDNAIALHDAYVADVQKDAAARDDEIQRLKDDLEERETAHRNELLRLQAAFDQEKADYEKRIATLNGSLEESRVDARYTQWLRNKFHWHSGGGVELDSEMLQLWQARQDYKLADFRLPVPDWMNWR